MLKLYLIFGITTVIGYLAVGVGTRMINEIRELEGDFWVYFINISSDIGSLLMCLLLWPLYSIYLLQGFTNAYKNKD